MAKMDTTTRIYKEVFNVEENHQGINDEVKAVIVNFGDERGDIIVENDNFGTMKKYADFTEGKKKAGLHPMQIVFSGIESAKMFDEKYIGKDGQIHSFREFEDTIREILNKYRMSIKDVSARFGIPYRTVQNWVGGQRECPKYIIKMMSEILENEN